MNANSDAAPLEIAPDLPETQLRARFERDGRLHVPDVLTEDTARRIHSHLMAQQDWDLVFRLEGQHRDLNYRDVLQWARADRDRLEGLVAEEARKGFQYCFANVPIYDVWHRRMLPGHFFEELFGFLNSAPWLDLVRRLTGADDIGFADAQATRYAPGHFLTRHDDDVAGKHRRIAYVLNLTPRWQPDWGGTLVFHDEEGHLERGFSPAWNALNLFRVPQSHAVTCVAPFAPTDRYAITGWCRAGSDPGPD